ncbi:unnamed protein product [Echinostoma caproni]|uniref:Uncharacterized protein n=1 Tax=Echinostoma caproni TaxID=27848 RepID=A0A183B3K4_9TREM|nr:unnamed protein product [Echinostoma caproni]
MMDRMTEDTSHSDSDLIDNDVEEDEYDEDDELEDVDDGMSEFCGRKYPDCAVLPGLRFATDTVPNTALTSLEHIVSRATVTPLPGQ